MKRHYTQAEIRGSWQWKEQVDKHHYILMASVYRPISFYLAWVFLRLGMSANQVTYLSGIVGVAGLALLGTTSVPIRVLGALLANMWIVLDCVDGDIARCTNTSSQYGHFLDRVAGYIVGIFVFMFAGVGALNHFDRFQGWLAASSPHAFHAQSVAVFLFAAGFWASLSSSFGRLIYQKYKADFAQGDEFQPHNLPEPSLGLNLRRWAAIVADKPDFIFPLLLLATAFDTVSLFVFLYALINSMIMLYSLIKVRQLVADQ